MRTCLARLYSSGFVLLMLLPRSARAQSCDNVVHDERGCHLPPNTCGPAEDSILKQIINALVPDTYEEASFLGACRHHDVCWGTCDSDKSECDEAFFRDLSSACRVAYPFKESREDFFDCVQRAILYSRAVDTALGRMFYADAQQSACACCHDEGGAAGASGSEGMDSCAEQQTFHEKLSAAIVPVLHEFDACTAAANCTEATGVSIDCPSDNHFSLGNYAVRADKKAEFLAGVADVGAMLCPDAPPPAACGGGIGAVVSYSLACTNGRCDFAVQ